MKNLYILFSFLLIPFFGTGQYTFQRSYQIGQNSYGCSALQTPDGGFAICGVTTNPSPHKIFLIKTDAFGDSLWTKYYDGELEERDHIMHLTKDGGFIICGYRDQHILLIRTDSKGDTLWEKILANGYGVSVDVANDNGFILAADSNYYSRLIKTDSSGNIQWSKAYYLPGGSFSTAVSLPTCVKATFDDGYVVTGECHDNWFAMTLMDAFLIKTNSWGDSLWANIYSLGYPYVYAIYSLDESPDHGFILAGITFCQPGKASANYDNGLLIRTDSTGESLWIKTTYDSISYFKSVCSPVSGDFYAAGASTDLFWNQGSGRLEHRNIDGDTLWIKNYNAQTSYLNSVSSCSDGGFLMCGYGWDSYAVYLVKTDALGMVYPYGIDEQASSKDASVYPNPTSGIFTVKTEVPVQSVEVLSSICSTIMKIEGTRNLKEITINLTGQPSGIYLVKLISDKGIIVKKIVLR